MISCSTNHSLKKSQTVLCTLFGSIYLYMKIRRTRFYFVYSILNKTEVTWHVLWMETAGDRSNNVRRWRARAQLQACIKIVCSRSRIFMRNNWSRNLETMQQWMVAPSVEHYNYCPLWNFHTDSNRWDQAVISGVGALLTQSTLIIRVVRRDKTVSYLNRLPGCLNCCSDGSTLL